MNLYEKIIAIYPELGLKDFMGFNSTITLQNDSDGKGDYIAKWEHPEFPKPTQKMLDEVK